MPAIERLRGWRRLPVFTRRLGPALWFGVQTCLPQRLLARVAHRLAHSRLPWLKALLIRLFLRCFSVNMDEAEKPDAGCYDCFHDFFIRRLRADARPLAPDGLAAPVDGVVNRAGRLQGSGVLVQAKGHHYLLGALLAHDALLTRKFAGGMYATFYLAPRAYHRVHMPLAGTLQQMVLVPGRFFGVGDYSMRGVSRLFVRNERLINVFSTGQGSMAIIMVGAMLVGSLATVWHGVVRGKEPCVQAWHYGDEDPPIQLGRGAEMGHFSMGSTVILLLSGRTARWLGTVRPGRFFRMGEQVAE